MLIFLTGGSGFVGSAVLEELAARAHRIHALVHHRELHAPGDVRFFRGELTDPRALGEAMAGCDAVVHLVGIIAEKPRQGITFERIHVEGTRAVVDAANAAGIRRFVHLSALGTRPDAQSDYHKTKFRAEECVRQSRLNWTILRPSFIHGPAGDFLRMEAKWARGQAMPYLFMPYFGRGPLGTGGSGTLQPVYVKDVARAVADALEKPATAGKTYDVVGSEVLTWPQLHRAAARQIAGRNRRTLPIPAWWAKLLTRALPASLLPFNRDQVIMSLEDNTGDPGPFETDFGWRPGGFTEALAEYARGL